MKRDPICGMIVNPDTAFHVEREGEINYFCSEEYREQFLSAQMVARHADPATYHPLNTYQLLNLRVACNGTLAG